MASMTRDDLERTLKRVVTALRGAGVPFLLAGGVAAWARGGPASQHDIDVVVRPRDAESALRALADHGMRAEDPPEEWLAKAWDGDTLVDVIHRLRGLAVDDEVFARADELEVLGMSVEVMALEDVIGAKLLALDEHELDFSPLLEIARAVREQIDWDVVAERTASSPFARTFLFLVRELDIAEPPVAAR